MKNKLITIFFLLLFTKTIEGTLAEEQKKTLETTLKKIKKNKDEKLQIEAKQKIESENTIKQNIKFSGFIKLAAYDDTRQVYGARDDYFLLYPEKKELLCGLDKNAKAQGYITPIESRLRVDIDGPKIWELGLNGVIEGDFFGTNEENIYTPRMRLAYLNIRGKQFSILAGQEYHPLTPLKIIPETVSFNSGCPMEPFARSPQLRFTLHFPKINAFLCLLSQSPGEVTPGFEGCDCKYLRDAVVPNISLGADTKIKDSTLGCCLDWKQIRPRLKSIDETKTVSEMFASTSFCAYTSIDIPKAIIKGKFTYGNNLPELSMLGGYAVQKISGCCSEENTIANRSFSYTGLRAIAIWNDNTLKIHKRIEPGLFWGYTKNIGANDDFIISYKDSNGVTTPLTFTLTNATQIDYVFRLSPRIKIKEKPVVFGGEIEWTRARYGTIKSITTSNSNNQTVVATTDKGSLENLYSVNNIRFIATVSYNF
ncbi:MAG: Outer membrane protein [candidate division TM6 bacterium GW2011_GWF2_32_72]|nr:MAG: Outer membrane protein [candidate division TM6 bacterium GW2011_GWF2_32_72]